MGHFGTIVLLLTHLLNWHLSGGSAIKTCEKSQFKCNSGRCIPDISVCDGDKDCEDGIDEAHCLGRTCPGFVCKDGSCIAQSALCDGNGDCSDGSDEYKDTCDIIKCKRDEFACSNRRCVSLSFCCNGKDDCGDGSDEVSCQNCTANSFHCVQSGSCLPQAKVCDGHPDCHDGSDELSSMCASPRPVPHTCPSTVFRCGTGQCVPHSWRCDHSNDCEDGSDEDNCDQNECLQNNGGCSHLCVDQPLGFVCDCPSGMRLVRDVLCEEIDECLDTDVCNQMCVQVNGNLTCECHEGYLKSPRTGECKARGDMALVVFSSLEGVRWINSAGLEYRDIAPGISGPGPVTVLSENRTLYWANPEQDTIYRISLDECNQKPVLLLRGPGAILGLAVDWIHELLYWTNTKSHSINVATLDGSKQRLLIGGLSKPTGVAVEPLLGLLFWADGGHSPRIERASMDGQGRILLVTSAIHSPVAVSLDMPRRLLYWVDSGMRTISRVDFEGQHRKTVVESNGYLDRPFGLAVFEGRVYWSDQVTHSICSADKHRGNLLKVLLPNIDSPGGLVIAHSVLQPRGHAVCGHSGRVCLYQCLPELFSDSEMPQFSCTSARECC